MMCMTERGGVWVGLGWEGRDWRGEGNREGGKENRHPRCFRRISLSVSDVAFTCYKRELPALCIFCLCTCRLSIYNIPLSCIRRGYIRLCAPQLCVYKSLMAKSAYLPTRISLANLKSNAPSRFLQRASDCNLLIYAL
jgi:hypothetical protein